MKILYDHQAFNQIIGGVSKSYVSIIKHIISKFDIEIAIKYSKNKYINEILPNLRYPFNDFYIPYKRRITNKINFQYAIKRLKEANYDVFHATFDDCYFLHYVKTPFIITIHDLIPESEPAPKFYKWLESRKKIFPEAHHIITVSQNTKKELLYYYPNLDESKISVIHHGYEPVNYPPIANKYGNYILYVGGRNGYKNFDRFINVCTPILNGNRNLNLICTGTRFSINEKRRFSELNIRRKIFQVTANEIEMQSLYKNALFLIFPSLKEGFGLPILEAWGNNCPVTLSNIGTFKEIAGDAGLYFNPLIETEIQDCIVTLLNDVNIRNNLIEKGRNRLEQFTWDISAIQYEKIYKTIS